MSKIDAETIERFYAKVKVGIPQVCWEWHGSKTKQGYGLFWPERRTTRTAHSFAYEIVHGVQSTHDMQIHHTCYNKACVNVLHLELVTAEFNTRDAFNTETCANGHEWTKENTYIKPTGQRECRECRYLRGVRLNGRPTE